jgi:Lar family restriction alleviation protein
MKKASNCPFCGERGMEMLVVRDMVDNEHTAQIECPRCHAAGPTAHGESEDIAKDIAIARWNKRVCAEVPPKAHSFHHKPDLRQPLDCRGIDGGDLGKLDIK